MTRYTVIGVFEDYDYARYASYFDADNPEHAEEQARDEAGETLIVAAVILGEAVVVA